MPNLMGGGGSGTNKSALAEEDLESLDNLVSRSISGAPQRFLVAPNRLCHVREYLAAHYLHAWSPTFSKVLLRNLSSVELVAV